jgi:UPF0755 protein
MMSRLLIALFLVAIAAGVAYTEIERRWSEPLTIPSSGYELVVSPGDSLRSVAASLHADGVLVYPELLVLQGRWTKVDSRIRQGEYLLPDGLTPADLLAQLVKGDVRRYQVTLPEGITLAQVLDILWSESRLTRTIQDSEDVRIDSLIEPYTHPEGLFFPDSYQYTRGDSDWSILQRAHSTMVKALQQEWENRDEGLPLETAYDALILASIVERETGVKSERSAIAGVFTRRLIKRMRLQTDPTVIYGLGAAYTGNLQRRHLADDLNAYNTYRHHGLPPTPIALPGRAAIHAVLHPAQSAALYFVAKGDGSHTFSDTLADHNSAVRKYQLKRRQDYRSSPESR